MNLKHLMSNTNSYPLAEICEVRDRICATDVLRGIVDHRDGGDTNLLNNMPLQIVVSVFVSVVIRGAQATHRTANEDLNHGQERTLTIGKQLRRNTRRCKLRWR